MGPVEPGAGQKPDRAAIQAGMHPVAVEFDFVEPLRPIRRLVDESGELRFDPAGERHQLGAPPSTKRPRHVFRHDGARWRRSIPAGFTRSPAA
jgi:hypothetical protein